MPSLEEVNEYLIGVWQRQWLTNNGPLLNEYELRLKKQLGVKHLLVLNNGTIALQIAIKALGLKGEIITTPFSYVATTSSIVWEGCEPVFVDIDESTFNIDPSKIEAAITPKTTAILATHCFGNACDIDAIAEIAERHQLKVIYDAAHCYGTTYKGRSIFEFGDISTLSLHATKIVHCVEGGAVFTNDAELVRRMSLLRNFGHSGTESFDGVGINGKNSELHAAMGLAVLSDARYILEARKKQAAIYDEVLKEMTPVTQKTQEYCETNSAYYPVVFEDERITLAIKKALNDNEIFPRRYFKPSLSSLDYVGEYETPVSDSVASRILCLPLYHDLTPPEQELIARIMIRTTKYL